MKKSIAIFLALVLAASCEGLDRGQDGIFRADRLGSGTRSTRGKDADSTGRTSVEEPPAPVFDTTVWVCAVKVPDNYDWPRDTAMGTMQAELLLYKDGEQVLSLPVGASGGISPNPETHHLTGGHLYTEYPGAGSTVVTCDGQVAFSITSREVLRGLLVREGNILTLGCNMADNSLSLRENGKLLKNYPEAVAYGSLGERVPALYEDGGHFWFAYRSSGNAYLCRDGNAQLQKSGVTVTDCRQAGGSPRTICNDGSEVSFESMDKTYSVCASSRARGTFTVHNLSGSIFVSGPVEFGGTKTMVKNFDTGSTAYFAGGDLLIYGSAGKIFAVQAETTLVVQEAAAQAQELQHIAMGKTVLSVKDAYFFSGGCAYSLDGSLYVAVSRKGEKPYIWKDGEKIMELPINGYITGVEVTVSQSSG